MSAGGGRRGAAWAAGPSGRRAVALGRGLTGGGGGVGVRGRGLGLAASRRGRAGPGGGGPYEAGACGRPPAAAVWLWGGRGRPQWPAVPALGVRGLFSRARSAVGSAAAIGEETGGRRLRSLARRSSGSGRVKTAGAEEGLAPLCQQAPEGRLHASGSPRHSFPAFHILVHDSNV